MRVVFVSWRDLAHPQAGGSEILVDRIARGCLERGHEATLICAAPVGPRPYRVVAAGGDFTQYARAPLAYLRRFRGADLVVDVENGIPFFAPLWRRGPVLCLVNHVHTDQWRLRFPTPVAAAGSFVERRAMPRAYRRCLFAAVSPSTAEAVAQLGVDPARIRLVPNGVDLPPPPTRSKSATPLFLVLGRLAPHKRVGLALRVWERVRPVVGGRLVIAGEGPERGRIRALAGEGVEILGRIGDDEKLRLLEEAWLLVHPALHEGWGIVVMEAAASETPTLGFDVPGVRDAVVDGETGALVSSEEELERTWIALARDARERERMGRRGRERAGAFGWDATVDRFLDVAAEAVALGS